MARHPGLTFQVGDQVIERLGSGQAAVQFQSEVMVIEDGRCLTESGRSYDALTGRGTAAGPYHAIHHVEYQKSAAMAVQNPGQAAIGLKGGVE